MSQLPSNSISLGPTSGPAEVLLCPLCGDIYTHINRVTMYDASGHGLAIVGDGEDALCTMSAEVVSPGPDRLVGRRQIVVLTVDCEQCRQTSEVRFMQHKGNTLVSVGSPSALRGFGDASTLVQS